MNRTIGDWLLFCADPLGPRRPQPRHPIGPDAARELAAQAEAHGVLPAVMRNFPPFADDPRFAAAAGEAGGRLRQARTLSFMLRGELEAIAGELVAMPVATVKGPVFARRIYPDPSLRTYTDIDLLAAPDAVPRLGDLLASRGFRLAEDGSASGRGEWKWQHRDNVLLMVEVQTDLVHAGSLRSSLSLTYDDLAGETATAAGCLLIALVHGAFSHAYERLQHVVDICQAARALDTADEERRFEAMVLRTGARYAAAIGLHLAASLFHEPRCTEIARGLGPAGGAGIAGMLVGRATILSSRTAARPLHSWRRQLFRELLKRQRS